MHNSFLFTEKADGHHCQLRGVYQGAFRGARLQGAKGRHPCTHQQGFPLPRPEQSAVQQRVRQHRPAHQAAW